MTLGFVPASVVTQRRFGAARRCDGRRRMVVMSEKALQALIFDCDGVLADTERDAHRVAFNIAFKENNLDTEWSEERYGKGDRL